MRRSEYFREASRLSNVFGEKLQAVEDHLDADPELKAEGAYKKYWALEGEANAAGGAWIDFCSLERPRILG